MRKILKNFIVFLLFIILIGVSGCSKNPEDYKQDILSYLEAKYDEEFVVDSMRKEVGIGTSDLIRAECYSKQFPEIKFTVQYQLDFNDIHNEEEIADLLKQLDSNSEENLKEWEEEVEPYLEDDYANILFQNKYDQMLERNLDINRDYLIQSVFTTPNYFPNTYESRGEFDEYMSSENFDLVSYHFFFIKDQGDTTDNKLEIINKISNNTANSDISMQLIYFYFISDFSVENLTKEFFRNYKDPNKYFEDTEYTVSKGIISIDKGIVQDSREDILEMLGGN